MRDKKSTATDRKVLLIFFLNRIPREITQRIETRYYIIFHGQERRQNNK